MILEELRKKALYQNSIEIWIGISEEKKIDWVNTDNYQKFIAFLSKNELNMKQMTICFDESDNASYGGHSKKVFANNLAAINDVNSHCYSIKLKDSAIELIRTFVMDDSSGVDSSGVDSSGVDSSVDGSLLKLS